MLGKCEKVENATTIHSFRSVPALISFSSFFIKTFRCQPNVPLSRTPPPPGLPTISIIFRFPRLKRRPRYTCETLFQKIAFIPCFWILRTDTSTKYTRNYSTRAHRRPPLEKYCLWQTFAFKILPRFQFQLETY